MLKIASKKIWSALTILIVIAGIFVSIGRIATPYLNNFKAEIETEASKLIGSNVKIGEIRGLWHGFGPAVILRDIQISNSNQHTPPLRFDRIDLDLSLKQIIKDGQFLPWNITLHGINLKLVKDTDGKLQVMGLNKSSSNDSDTTIITALLSLHRIQLVNSNIAWIDLSKKTPDTLFTNIDLLLRNDINRHQLDLSLNLPGEDLQSIEILADIITEENNFNQWSAQTFIKTHNFDATQWINSLFPDFAHLNKGNFDSNLWLNMNQDEFTKISGDFNASNIEVIDIKTKQSLSINQVQSNFNLEKDSDFWQFDMLNSQLQINNASWENTSLSFKLDNQDQLALRINYLDTQILQDISPFLSDDLKLLSKKIQLEGVVTNLNAYLKKDLSDWYVEANLKDFSLLPQKPKNPKTISYPGIKNLTAHITAIPEKGLLQIDTSNAQYIHNGLFRNPISLNTLDGDLIWRKTSDNHWQVLSKSLIAVTPQITTASKLLIDIPANEKPTVNIQTDFENGDASLANLYYPVGIMNDQLVDWLDHSVVSGEVTSGSFILTGPLENFPFDKTHDGHFEVLFNVKNLELDYYKQWPKLDAVTGQVRFHNNSLGIQVSDALLLDTQVTNAQVKIESLDHLTPINITANTSGPTSDMFRVLSETPLKKDFEHLTSALKMNGNSKLELDLTIPLSEIGTQQADGVIYFDNNELQLTDLDFNLSKLNGVLNFDLNGISSKNLSAFILGHKSAIKISHDKDGTTQVHTKLNIHTSQLKKVMPEFPIKIISGQSDFDLSLSVPPLSQQKTNSLKIKLASDLHGISVNMPKPFLKLSPDARDFSLKTSIGKDAFIPIQVRYDNIHALLHINRSNKAVSKLKAGQLHFGPKPTYNQPLQNILLTGFIDKVDIIEWLNWSDNLPQNTGKSLPIILNLSTKQLQYRDVVFNDFTIKANLKDDSLIGNIKSNEVEGKFSIPHAKTFDKLIIDLDKAAITLDLDSNDEDKKTTFDTFNPASAPSLDISIKNFSLNTHDFGTVNLISHRQKESMKLESFKLNSELVNINVSGLWSVVEDRQKTALDFELDSNDFGTVLQRFGYVSQIAKGNAKLSGRFWWYGGPQKLSQEILSGDLNIDIQDGRFVQLEPGVGRVLGILNVAALYRRLTLDFSDLFKKGFTFDDISGDFFLDQGDAYTNNLFIKSPSAKINLSGRTGLKNKDYDQLVTVLPSLQSSLTLAGAIGGGPAGAALGFLAQKLIGDQIDKLGKTQYTITGSWENPEITKVDNLKNESEPPK